MTSIGPQLLAAIALLAVVPSAKAATFYFEFTSNKTTYDTVVDGTIILPDGEGPLTPSEIYVDAAADAPQGYNFQAVSFDQIAGDFDVSNGQIVGGQVYSQKPDGTSILLYGDGSAASFVENGVDFFPFPHGEAPDSGPNYASAAPEPSTWALMFAGVAGIGLMLRRARKTMGFRFKDAFAA